MKSSSPRPELFRTLLHPVISVTVSTSSVLAALVLLARLTGVSGPGGLTVAAVIVAPLVEAAVGNLLYAERAGIGNRVRELIIYLLLAYAVFSLVRPGPLAARFAPSAVQMMPLLAAGAAWLHAYGIHNRLRGREGLLRTLHGKHGDPLRHALIERQHDMALTVRELRRARGAVAAGFLFLSGLAIITATGIFTSSDLPALSWGFILLCVNGAVSALTIGALNTYIDEYAVNGVGLRVPFRFQRRRLVAGGIVVLVALAGAFALSRRESLLPLESIAAFFRWFGGLFDRERVPPLPQPAPESTQSPSQYELMLRMLGEVEPSIPPLWVRLLAQLLRRLIVAVVAAVVAVLIFGPIFSPAFRSGLKQFRPRQALRDLLHRFRRQAVVLARWLRTRLLFGRRRARTESADSSHLTRNRAATTGRGWKPSIVKRRQMDRVAAVFASVVKWGSDHGLVYRSSEGAREFLCRVADLYPEHGGDAQTCARTFWEARYSRHMVPLKGMREYVRAARRITAAG